MILYHKRVVFSISSHKITARFLLEIFSIAPRPWSLEPDSKAKGRGRLWG